MPVLVCYRGKSKGVSNERAISKSTRLSLWPSQIHVHLEGCHADFGSTPKPDRSVTPRRLVTAARSPLAVFHLEANKPELVLFRRCRATIFPSFEIQVVPGVFDSSRYHRARPSGDTKPSGIFCKAEQVAALGHPLEFALILLLPARRCARTRSRTSAGGDGDEEGGAREGGIDCPAQEARSQQQDRSGRARGH